MNNKEFIAELAQRSGYTQMVTQQLVNTLVDEMGKNFDEGRDINIPQFGTFELKKRLERVVVNPSSGKKMLVPPKIVLGFRPISAIKEILKNNGEEEE